MKKHLTLITFLLLFSFLAKAQSTKFSWSKNLGSTNNDKGTYITTDKVGNIYSAGTFRNTADLDPGIGTFNVTSLGMNDIYLIKQDPSGGVMWFKHFGGIYDDVPISIEVDDMGSIYLTGTFMNFIDFNLGFGGFILNSVGDRDIFWAKFDEFGNIQWAKRTGGIEPDFIMSTSLDRRGYIYSTGTFRSTADFNPSPFITNLTAVAETDVFITKYDLNGNLSWARSVGTGSEDTGRSIAIDAAGNVYVLGTFKGAGDFNPGFGTDKLSTLGENDIFLLKLNSFGNFVWVKQIGGPSDDVANSINVTDSGFIFLTGHFSGMADFDPNPLDSDTAYLTAKSNKDMFTAKLDLNGNLIWAKNIGESGAECSGMVVKNDITGNVFITGIYTNTIDFDPDTTNFWQTSKGLHDFFITKMDKDGNFNWVKSFGGIMEDSSISMYINLGSSIYTTGSFGDTVDFNPAKEVFGIRTKGNSDAFLLKMDYCTPSFTTIKDTACETYMLDGVVYDQSGIYNQTITGKFGCEEFVTLDLDIHHLNDTVNVSGVILTAQATGVQYQWIGCKYKNAIPGATGKSYIALGNAEYAVTIFDGYCSDTSICHEISSFPTSIGEFDLKNAVQVYPNPSKGNFVIEIAKNMIGSKASIYNLLGQNIRNIDLDESISAQTLNPGFYIIEIKSLHFNIMKKISIE